MLVTFIQGSCISPQSNSAFLVAKSNFLDESLARGIGASERTVSNRLVDSQTSLFCLDGGSSLVAEFGTVDPEAGVRFSSTALFRGAMMEKIDSSDCLHCNP